MVGATHPSLLCARLYADRLGAWDDAMAVVEGFLAIPKIAMNPLARIEAWRLLARCRGANPGTAPGAGVGGVRVGMGASALFVYSR